LVPSGIAGNFSSLGALRALDVAVDGEANVELSNSGEFLDGDAKLKLGSGQITPPWDPDSPMRIDHGNLDVPYVKAEDAGEIAPSTLDGGKSKATISGRFHPLRDASGEPASWDFVLRADEATLAVEEFGLPPMKVDEWRVNGSISAKDGCVTLGPVIIRSRRGPMSPAGGFFVGAGSPGCD